MATAGSTRSKGASNDSTPRVLTTRPDEVSTTADNQENESSQSNTELNGEVNEEPVEEVIGFGTTNGSDVLNFLVELQKAEFEFKCATRYVNLLMGSKIPNKTNEVQWKNKFLNLFATNRQLTEYIDSGKVSTGFEFYSKRLTEPNDLKKFYETVLDVWFTKFVCLNDNPFKNKFENCHELYHYYKSLAPDHTKDIVAAFRMFIYEYTREQKLSEFLEFLKNGPKLEGEISNYLKLILKNKYIPLVLSKLPQESDSNEHLLFKIANTVNKFYQKNLTADPLKILNDVLNDNPNVVLSHCGPRRNDKPPYRVSKPSYQGNSGNGKYYRKKSHNGKHLYVKAKGGHRSDKFKF
ncbi:hypothetical protein KGF54_001827 [Candida jiufengensis]|uniref:uncharacterized protein n=1 Tax=Candida jiufengensis TaxID=497108 RepID=UPI002224CC05|nr:uncharacterized protein KGF54_001827 [Candida jiufengensis]KAI5955266.1 hypothetical protein KGF54_001827 [Candida jiufengensis]